MSASAPADYRHPEEPTLTQYRAVSRAAVAALLLGLAATLALVSPLLVVVPLAAIVAGLVALRNIAAGGGLVVGKSLAIAGIALAALLGGWSLARHFSRQATVANQAIRLADGWLAMVRSGQRESAHQLSLAPSQRMSSVSAAAEYYKSNIKASDDLARYFGDEPLKSFVAAGPQVAFRLESVAQQASHHAEDEIVLKYTFDRPGGGSQPMWIIIVRTVDEKTNIPGWDIRGVQADPPSGLDQ